MLNSNNILYRIFYILLISWPTISVAQQRNNVLISLNSGYQWENFSWSIAGDINGQNPNIYSELKWKRLEEPTTSGTIKWQLSHYFYMLGEYDHSFIISGKVSDTDYGSDNRSTPIYHGDFQDNKGYNNKLILAVGASVINRKKIIVDVQAGYTLSHQSLYILGLNGLNPELNTTYFTTWKGSLIAGSLRYLINKKVSFEELISYSQLNYKARANWNLIQQFAHPVSYRDNASGYNLQFKQGIIYQINNRLAINAHFCFSHLQTGNGTDHLYLADNSQEETQFNAARGTAFQTTMGITIGLW